MLISSTHTRSGCDALGKHGTSGVHAYFCMRNPRQKYGNPIPAVSSQPQAVKSLTSYCC